MWWPFRRRKYCKYCGNLMEWRMYGDGYDRDTGEQKMYRKWMCTKGCIVPYFDEI